MQDINLYHLLRFYVKKWAFIALLTIVGGVAGFVYSSYIQTPLYKSDATLLLVNTDTNSTTQGSKLINNYIELIKSRRVLEPVLGKQNYGISYGELAGSIQATNEKNTEVIKIAIDTKDPQVSRELVDGVVASFREEVKELYNLENITVVDNASQPTEPYNIRTFIFTALTTAAGFFLSTIILFFVYDLSKQAQKPGKKAQKTKNKKTANRSIVKKISHMFFGTEDYPTSIPALPPKPKSAEQSATATAPKVKTKTKTRKK